MPVFALIDLRRSVGYFGRNVGDESVREPLRIPRIRVPNVRTNSLPAVIKRDGCVNFVDA